MATGRKQHMWGYEDINGEGEQTNIVDNHHEMQEMNLSAIDSTDGTSYDRVDPYRWKTIHVQQWLQSLSYQITHYFFSTRNVISVTPLRD